MRRLVIEMSENAIGGTGNLMGLTLDEYRGLMEYIRDFVRPHVKELRVEDREEFEAMTEVEKTCVLLQESQPTAVVGFCDRGILCAISERARVDDVIGVNEVLSQKVALMVVSEAGVEEGDL